MGVGGAAVGGRDVGGGGGGVSVGGGTVSVAVAGIGVLVGVADGVSVGVAVSVGVFVGVWLGVAVADAVAVAVGVAVSVTGKKGASRANVRHSLVTTTIPDGWAINLIRHFVTPGSSKKSALSSVVV